MAISRSEARQLAINSTKMGARVLRGILTVGPNGTTQVDGIDISEWLAQHTGAEMMLIAMLIDKPAFENELKSCQTCGRDYKGDACPHCAKVRARLRG